MNEHASLADITFTENGLVDVAQLNALYRCIGWDSHHRRTEVETTEMLRVSHYYIAAQTAEGTLVGFARVCGDPYVAQVLDVITHPAYRRRGIATQCMRGVLAHLQRSRYVSVTLTDGSGIAGFYQRFGFRVCKDVAQRWERGPEAISKEADSASPSAPERPEPQSIFPRLTRRAQTLGRSPCQSPGRTTPCS